MSFLERAKQAAGQARQAASGMAEQARQAATEAADQAHDVAAVAAEQARDIASDAAQRTSASLHDPATIDRARTSLHLARRGVSTAIERIDPAILADVIIKATSLQERSNATLRDRGSPYRIGTVSLGASIPPSVTFSIVRLGDPEADEAAPTEAALEPPAGGRPEPITVLDGTQLTEADLADLPDVTGDRGPA